MEKFILLFLKIQKSSFPQVEPDEVGEPFAQMIEAEDWEEALAEAYKVRKYFEVTGDKFRLVQITVGA